MTTSAVTSRTLSTAVKQVRKPLSFRRVWGRYVLIGLVVTYIGLLIILPLVRLVLGAFEEGIAPIATALADPAVLRSFWLTLWISALTVVVHAIFGTIVAWVLVR